MKMKNQTRIGFKKPFWHTCLFDFRGIRCGFLRKTIYETSSTLILSVTMAVLLAGCATTFQKPTPDTDYGEYPPSNYQELIKDAVERKFDPSARYSFSEPRRGYGNNGLLYGGKVEWTGYGVSFFVYTKGIFTTNRVKYIALFRNGKLVRFTEDGPLFRYVK